MLTSICDKGGLSLTIAQLSGVDGLSGDKALRTHKFIMQGTSEQALNFGVTMCIIYRIFNFSDTGYLGDRGPCPVFKGPYRLIPAFMGTYI